MPAEAGIHWAYGHCAPMALLLKHGRTGNFELEPDAYRKVFQACVAAVGDDYLYTMLTYAAELSNPLAGKKILSFIEEVLSNKQDVIMTYGQQLRQAGRQEERLTLAKTMLEAQEPKEKVMKFTSLTLQQIEQLDKETPQK